MAKINNHDWVRYSDSYPDWQADGIDMFAGLDHEFHNGPRCKRCGRCGVCVHCHPELWDEECPIQGE